MLSISRLSVRPMTLAPDNHHPSGSTLANDVHSVQQSCNAPQPRTPPGDTRNASGTPPQDLAQALEGVSRGLRHEDRLVLDISKRAQYVPERHDSQRSDLIGKHKSLEIDCSDVEEICNKYSHCGDNLNARPIAINICAAMKVLYGCENIIGFTQKEKSQLPTVYYRFENMAGHCTMDHEIKSNVGFEIPYCGSDYSATNLFLFGGYRYYEIFPRTDLKHASRSHLVEVNDLGEKRRLHELVMNKFEGKLTPKSKCIDKGLSYALTCLGDFNCIPKSQCMAKDLEHALNSGTEIDDECVAACRSMFPRKEGEDNVSYYRKLMLDGLFSEEAAKVAALSDEELDEVRQWAIIYTPEHAWRSDNNALSLSCYVKAIRDGRILPFAFGGANEPQQNSSTEIGDECVVACRSMFPRKEGEDNVSYYRKLMLDGLFSEEAAKVAALSDEELDEVRPWAIIYTLEHAWRSDNNALSLSCYIKAVRDGLCSARPSILMIERKL
ncbi:hypothetical protein [Burkholderia ubonensis]|uniref:hypothetical protein n=1 Tax=Burkholderia ubonensis TaxID=101571 RepID=UPI0012F8E9FC|nr:hypothetical protein [Burkholderia ubonensis]